MTKWEMKALVAALGVQERVLLFCLASGTDWKQAGVTYKTLAGMMGWPLYVQENGRIEMTSVRHLALTRTWPGGRLALTAFGRAALRELVRAI